MTTKIDGQLEIDHERGVIYFHCIDKAYIRLLGTMTPLRICQLPKPIPHNVALDVTYGHGTNWRNEEDE